MSNVVDGMGIRRARSPFLFTSKRIDPSQPSPEHIKAYALRELLRRKAVNDPNAFALYAMRDAQGLEMEQQWFQVEWHGAASVHPRTLIMCPRSHGKTEQMSVVRPIWELGRNPNLRIKVVAQSDSKSSTILQQISTNILKNDKIREVFPHLQPMDKGNWSKHSVMVERSAISKDPSIEALGILSSGTGGRADLIIFDDVVDFRNAIQQPALREVVKQAYYSVWINLLEPKGRVFYICTPWHKDDLSHDLLVNAEYHIIVYRIEEDVKSPGNWIPIWPSKWDNEALKIRRTEIGPREFDRQFRMLAISSEEQLFTLDKLKTNFVELDKKPNIDDIVGFYGGIDLAAFRKKNKDDKGWNAIFIAGVDKDGKRWPFEAKRIRAPAPEVVRLFYSIWQRYHMKHTKVENNAYQQSLIEWINELYDEPEFCGHIGAHTTAGQKAHPELGLPNLAMEFETMQWAIPVNEQGHPPACACDICHWITELVDYPIGKTFDVGMASWFSQSAIKEGTRRKGGFDTW